MKLSTKQKLWIAKAWMSIVLLFLMSLLAFPAVMGLWWVLGQIEWRIIFAIVAGATVFFSLLWVTHKADNYIDNHGGWNK